MRAAAIGMRGKRLEHSLGRDRLGEEVTCPGAHRIDGKGDRFTVTKHDDGQIGRCAAQRG